MRQKLLNTREASHELGLSEKEIIQLAQNNKIPHFRIGGEFLRFKRGDLLEVKPRLKKNCGLNEAESGLAARIKEFLYFNDFYIWSTAIIIGLLWLIVKDFF